MSAIKKLIGTGTAAFCIFDLEALAHRLDDDCDWWSVEEDEVEEINKGNCIIFGTGIDGGFDFEIFENEVISEPNLEVIIKAPSGKIYIGAGEEISGGNTYPKENSQYYNGIFLNLEKGNYLVTIKNDSSNIKVAISKTNKDAINKLTEPLMIEV